MKIGRIDVNPGDLVLADGSRRRLPRRGQGRGGHRAAEMIAGREALMKEAVMRGDHVSEVMGRDYERC